MATVDRIVLWLSRLFGILNLPIAIIGIIDGSIIFTLLNPSYLPQTAEQWIGFFTAISAILGAMAGLTIKSNYSPNRKKAHLLIAAFGFISSFNAFIRLVKTISIADWLF
ncbi:MAG: hypothetical protein Q7J35_17715 [Candidatus Methanoperedens sp.]|nr:hypothetical protein [Candidatus Methanoperedens sp.]